MFAAPRHEQTRQSKAEYQRAPKDAVHDDERERQGSSNRLDHARCSPGLPPARLIVPPAHRSVNAKFVTAALIGLLVFGVGGCSTVGFYAQAAAGQASLMLARKDVGEVIADPRSDPEVVRRLERVADMLRYAEDELHLPVGGRYGSYVKIDGALMWSVVAAPEFSIEAVPRCYPVIGCAIYRGYFAHARAAREARRLGVSHDVLVAEVAAYSTLGWFDDPILSSFLGYDEASLADLVFHELAHSVVYVAGDSAFNESFAGFVGNEGALRWLADNDGDAGGLPGASGLGRGVCPFPGGLAPTSRRSLPSAHRRLRQATAQGRVVRCHALGLPVPSATSRRRKLRRCDGGTVQQRAHGADFHVRRSETTVRGPVQRSR